MRTPRLQALFSINAWIEKNLPKDPLIDRITKIADPQQKLPLLQQELEERKASIQALIDKVEKKAIAIDPQLIGKERPERRSYLAKIAQRISYAFRRVFHLHGSLSWPKRLVALHNKYTSETTRISDKQRTTRTEIKEQEEKTLGTFVDAREEDDDDFDPEAFVDAREGDEEEPVSTLPPSPLRPSSGSDPITNPATSPSPSPRPETTKHIYEKDMAKSFAQAFFMSVFPQEYSLAGFTIVNNLLPSFERFEYDDADGSFKITCSAPKYGVIRGIGKEGIHELENAQVFAKFEDPATKTIVITGSVDKTHHSISFDKGTCMMDVKPHKLCPTISAALSHISCRDGMFHVRGIPSDTALSVIKWIPTLLLNRLPSEIREALRRAVETGEFECNPYSMEAIYETFTKLQWKD